VLPPSSEYSEWCLELDTDVGREYKRGRVYVGQYELGKDGAI